jgi:tRNA A-37 threonylcarbamoyl transferase component Bud32/membrane-associated phospholipid phosphatase
MTTSREASALETPVSPAPPTADRGRRRRRPTGAPPPLPKAVGVTGKVWLLVLAALLVWVVVALASDAVLHATDRLDSAILRRFADARTSWLTDAATGLNRVATGWTFSIVALGLVVALMVFKRWRHLFTFLGSVVVLEVIGLFIYERFTRPRPYDVTVIGRWAGASMPSPPVAVVAIVLVGIVYSVVVPGRPRTLAKWIVAAILGLFIAARLYLAVDHPSDIVVGLALGVAIPLAAFRMFTPSDSCPVTYRRGKTAHLDVGGRRGEAVRRAVLDQLGLTVVDLKPVGLEASGGSTPLRLRVAGDPDTYLFGKLYAMSHVRADRWYKLGRRLLYGRLEDEAPFQSVRRLVQYEDYTLRLLRDCGIPTAAPYGIVELTPEREYLLVTEFFDGAVEIGDAEVDDGVIDEGLLLVRRLWDSGLAHRDIKPANLLVRDGHVLVIDVFFVQVRPSPWRQAVDLANMMLVLAVRSDARRVYERALAYFTPDEIAEAFAAARGVASPTQLRAVMKKDGRDLVAQFRALAPERRTISLQRWGWRRFGLAAALLVAAAFMVPNIVGLFTPAYDLAVDGSPECGTGNLMILTAQSVPSATSVPCIETLPAGWELGGVRIKRNRTTFWLDSDLGGDRAVEVRLVRPDDCDVSGAMEVPSDAVGLRRFERPRRLPPGLETTRYYLFPGGCVTYDISFDVEAMPSLVFDVDDALAFQPREELVDEVRDDTDLRLCGAGSPCPDGT